MVMCFSKEIALQPNFYFRRDSKIQESVTNHVADVSHSLQEGKSHSNRWYIRILRSLQPCLQIPNDSRSHFILPTFKVVGFMLHMTPTILILKGF